MNGLYEGTLLPVEANRPDGTYGREWRGFFCKLDDGNNLFFEITVGGERNRLLSLEGQRVKLEVGDDRIKVGETTVRIDFAPEILPAAASVDAVRRDRRPLNFG